MLKARASSTLKGILLVNVATLAWATNILLGRALRNEAGPFLLTAGRYLVAALVFGMLLRKKAKEERQIGKDTYLLLSMAATGIVLFAPLLYFGLKFTTAVNGTLINGIGPLVTALFAALFIKEPFSRRQLGGATLAFLGVVVLIGGASLAVFRKVQFNPGDLWILLAVCVWGLYSVSGRKLIRHRSLPLFWPTVVSIFSNL
ncbi:MAG: DMT family transporter [Spirochaetales bacterium]